MKNVLNKFTIGTASWLVATTALTASIDVSFLDLPTTVPPAQNYSGGGVFYNGSDAAGSFSSGGVEFVNDYNSDFGSWSGWSYSTTTDTTTPGFTNQYSANTGSGNGDAVYGVFNQPFANEPTVLLGAGAGTPQSMFITNTTYASQSMLNGDAFAKQFGGTSGDDPDFFLLTIRGFNASNVEVGSVDFYLADYRFADNSLDYLVDSWTEVDLTDLGSGVAGLQFDLSSSDNGSFGMNTPAYFAMDNFSAVPEPALFGLIFGMATLACLALRRRR